MCCTITAIEMNIPYIKSIIFWDVTPCSLLSCNRRFGRTYRLSPAYLLVLAEIISSALKMEAISSSETSVATQQTTRRHIPEDDTLHNHRCENLKSYIPYISYVPRVDLASGKGMARAES
jgi:hypothetical protein